MSAGREAGLTWVGVQPLPELRIWGLVRYLVYLVLLVASLMFYTWSRIDVRTAAATLDASVLQLAELSAEAERLELELATRRDLAAVHQAGLALGLAADVALVDVHVEGLR